MVDAKRCVCWNKCCVRSFAGCADLNLAGLSVSCRKFIDAVMTILSGQSVISRGLHVTFWVTVRIAWNLGWGGTKKVPGTVPGADLGVGPEGHRPLLKSDWPLKCPCRLKINLLNGFCLQLLVLCFQSRSSSPLREVPIQNFKVKKHIMGWCHLSSLSLMLES